VPVAQATVAERPLPVAVELRLRGGRSLHFERTIDPAALSVLIRAVHCLKLLGQRLSARDFDRHVAELQAASPS
jgi:hypothetical protein